MDFYVEAWVTLCLGKNCGLLFHKKKNTSGRVILYTLKEKNPENINYGDYAKTGRDLIEDVELKLENKGKALLRTLVSWQKKKKEYVDRDLPLVFCLIFCTEIESPELFWWRFEFNYWLLDAKG